MNEEVTIDYEKLLKKTIKANFIIKINKWSEFKFKTRFNIFMFLLRLIIKICPFEIDINVEEKESI